MVQSRLKSNFSLDDIIGEEEHGSKEDKDAPSGNALTQTVKKGFRNRGGMEDGLDTAVCIQMFPWSSHGRMRHPARNKALWLWIVMEC